MKREDVSKIIPGITSDQLDSIMNLHGADITAKVNEITTLKAEKTTLTEQLSTANSKLEGYDPEWKAKAEQAKTDAAAQVAALEKGLVENFLYSIAESVGVGCAVSAALGSRVGLCDGIESSPPFEPGVSQAKKLSRIMSARRAAAGFLNMSDSSVNLFAKNQSA